MASTCVPVCSPSSNRFTAGETTSLSIMPSNCSCDWCTVISTSGRPGKTGIPEKISWLKSIISTIRYSQITCQESIDTRYPSSSIQQTHANCSPHREPPPPVAELLRRTRCQPRISTRILQTAAPCLALHLNCQGKQSTRPGDDQSHWLRNARMKSNQKYRSRRENIRRRNQRLRPVETVNPGASMRSRREAHSDEAQNKPCRFALRGQTTARKE